MGKKFGYARVSTKDQDLSVQRAALKSAGVSGPLLFEEKMSGTQLDGRVELERVLKLLGKGDTLVITRLDRLGRSLKDLLNITEAIKEAGAHLVVIEQSIDTSTPTGRALFGMLGVFAEFETDVRRERQAEGIAAAKAKGDVYKGRKRSLDRDKVKQLKADGKNPTEIARELRMGRSSVYRLLDELRKAA